MRTDDFRKNAARIALTSGLTPRQVVDNLGSGVSTLDKWTAAKGRGQTDGEGSFETPFAGGHGWFWRNRDDEAATVTLQLRGDYSAIVPGE